MLRRTRLLFVGDAVTAGYGVVPMSAYPHLVAARLAERGLDVRLAWTRSMHAGQFDGRQPENLLAEELKSIISGTTGL